MKTRTRLIILHISMISGLALADAATKHADGYGGPFTIHTLTSLDKAKASKDPVLVSGVVEKVCQKKGCWMTLKDGSKDIRVTFKDYGFFVPQSLVGKKIKAQGTMHEKVIPVAEARHYLEDEGKSKEEVMQIKEPVKTYSFIASAVKVVEN